MKVFHRAASTRLRARIPISGRKSRIAPVRHTLFGESRVVRRAYDFRVPSCDEERLIARMPDAFEEFRFLVHRHGDSVPVEREIVRLAPDDFHQRDYFRGVFRRCPGDCDVHFRFLLFFHCALFRLLLAIGAENTLSCESRCAWQRQPFLPPEPSYHRATPHFMATGSDEGARQFCCHENPKRGAWRTHLFATVAFRLSRRSFLYKSAEMNGLSVFSLP